jgi:uncharacterized repeat protein (TIGR03803 family)
VRIGLRISPKFSLFVLCAIATGPLPAQTFTVLHTFSGSDGANPFAGLISSGNTLFGTTENGGSSGSGTVFAINSDGTGFANIYNFTGGIDGAAPMAGLVLSGTTLYGTTSAGGSSSNGTVFAINTDGSGFTNLYNFTALSGSTATNNDGANPADGLVLAGNTLYGLAGAGGELGNGTVFSIRTDGSGFVTRFACSAMTTLPIRTV